MKWWPKRSIAVASAFIKFQFNWYVFLDWKSITKSKYHGTKDFRQHFFRIGNWEKKNLFTQFEIYCFVRCRNPSIFFPLALSIFTSNTRPVLKGRRTKFPPQKCTQKGGKIDCQRCIARKWHRISLERKTQPIFVLISYLYSMFRFLNVKEDLFCIFFHWLLSKDKIVLMPSVEWKRDLKIGLRLIFKFIFYVIQSWGFKLTPSTYPISAKLRYSYSESKRR